MEAYLGVVKSLAKQFDKFTLERIPRGENVQADALASLASTSDPDLKRIIPVEFIEHPNIDVGEPEVLMTIIEDEPDNNGEPDDSQPAEIDIDDNTEYGCDKEWLGPIRVYIADGVVPADKWAARRLKAQAARYILIRDALFKWRLSGPFDVDIDQADHIPENIGEIIPAMKNAPRTRSGTRKLREEFNKAVNIMIKLEDVDQIKREQDQEDTKTNDQEGDKKIWPLLKSHLGSTLLIIQTEDTQGEG